MKKLSLFAFLVVLLAVITSVYADGGRTAGLGNATSDINLSMTRGGDDDDDDAPDEFQVAFISRVDTDTIGEDGSEQLLGWAESLQAPVPGVVAGPFEENIGAPCNDTADFPPCPLEGACVPICDTVYTPEGSLQYQILVLIQAATENGPFATSSVAGEIVGGTGAWEGAQGSATLAGQVNICFSPGDGAGCATTNYLPEGVGIRYDCNFILRGILSDNGD